MAESFGCCSRFNECSDAKKCISPYPDLAEGCMYRTNLEAGRIFYGKNRNVGKKKESTQSITVSPAKVKPLSMKINIKSL